ncbi:hypothetical protein ERO13_D07G125401v2 [Gossypium hirsutum]|uniref:USP domain-containing protein n=1 Tax=Gossypium tomentosum TaxID=34277 RepID=A0A5D2K6R6_GOSTO|nr:hypothetical protein ERO13_D07G125401v2 [Gossypium hirsutum]TYH62750.1 hypothetical protein ES332_D07G141100v1 [Gossypium tomentosum]
MNAAFSGPYLCYVKNAQNKWFKIDDSMVCSLQLSSTCLKPFHLFTACFFPQSMFSSTLYFDFLPLIFVIACLACSPLI